MFSGALGSKFTEGFAWVLGLNKDCSIVTYHRGLGWSEDTLGDTYKVCIVGRCGALNTSHAVKCPDNKVHGANMGHRGPVGPRWAPCWPHEPCYQGVYWPSIIWTLKSASSKTYCRKLRRFCWWNRSAIIEYSYRCTSGKYNYRKSPKRSAIL